MSPGPCTALAWACLGLAQTVHPRHPCLYKVPEGPVGQTVVGTRVLSHKF